MARKQFGLKFDEEDVARWDAWAESQGLTRTTFLETAAERLISQGTEQAPPVSPAESRPPKLDTYPSAPTDPQERREWFNRRNAAIQGGSAAPAQEHYGGVGSKPPVQKRAK